MDYLEELGLGTCNREKARWERSKVMEGGSLRNGTLVIPFRSSEIENLPDEMEVSLDANGVPLGPYQIGLAVNGIPNRCFLCKERGHVKKECKNYCHECRSVGHSTEQHDLFTSPTPNEIKEREDAAEARRQKALADAELTRKRAKLDEEASAMAEQLEKAYREYQEYQASLENNENVQEKTVPSSSDELTLGPESVKLSPSSHEQTQPKLSPSSHDQTQPSTASAKRSLSDEAAESPSKVRPPSDRDGEG